MARDNFEFSSNLNNHFEATHEGLVRGLTAATLVAEGNAVLLAPIDTGRLRSDISHSIDEDKLESTIGNVVEYAVYLELGTSKQPAQPYLRPALQKNNVQEAFENEMRSAVEDD